MIRHVQIEPLVTLAFGSRIASVALSGFAHKKCAARIDLSSIFVRERQRERQREKERERERKREKEKERNRERERERHRERKREREGER